MTKLFNKLVNKILLNWIHGIIVLETNVAFSIL